MFKKKAHIKPFAPLRSSDRRKLAASVITDFNVPLPKLPPSETPAPPPTEDADPSKAEDDEKTAATTFLRNALFPENTSSAKFSTTHGPDLSPVNGTVYVGTHNPSPSGGVQRPLWIRTDDVFYPTCYTLHEVPTLLPFVYTHSGVMSKISGGADLMTPGLYGPPYGDSRAKKGALVAIGDIKAPNVAVAVGIAEVDVCELKDVRGEKGKAVRVLHWVGDELWNLGGTGGKVPEKIEVEDAGGGEEEGGVKLEEKMEELVVEEKEEEKVEEMDPVEEMTTKEIDNTFRAALIFSLHATLNSPDRAANPNQFLPFPLAGSYVLQELINPKLPSHHPSLQIGKTSWKKIGKMLKVMDKEGILKIKERGGDVLVHAVNWDDKKIKEFKPYPLPKASSSTSKATAGPSTSAPSSSAAGGNDAVKIVELFKPPQKLSAIYDATSTSTRDFYTASDLKTTLTKYFTSDPSKSLVSPTNGRIIIINPVIASTLLDDSIPTDAAIMSKGTVPRDLLFDRFQKLHQPYYQLIRAKTGEPLPSTVKPKSGQPPRITITMETRMGKKAVTKVKGLEVFGVDPVGFSEELRGLAASSTTVQDVVGSKPSDNLKEVLVQGSQLANVEKLLEKAGVGKRYVAVDDSKLKKKK